MNGPRAALLLSSLALLACAACAASGTRTSFDETLPGPEGEGDGAKGSEQPPPASDFDKTKPPEGQAPVINEVFGHSGDTLYRLDPTTKAVTVVGKFQGCASILDIALDESSNFFGVTYETLYRIDKATATCTALGTGKYPNSLSFVPKGTLDPNEEALVGYEDSDYIRIDTKTGKAKIIGALGNGLGKGLRSSGDIVSVKGGATYLTVKGGDCTTNDCLVEIDPKTGAVLKKWGSIEHKNVFGLSFWAGKIYGFDDTGNLFEVTFGTKQLATSVIAIPQKPADLKFWGAGSTTSAPLVETPQ